MAMKKPDPFYTSTPWLKCRVLALIRDNRLCQSCLEKNKLTDADMVHHIVSRKERPDLALMLENLVSLCNTCHNQAHPEKGQSKQKKPEKKRRAKVIESKGNAELL